MYQLIKNSTSILRQNDGAVIPADEGNSDYAAFLRWQSIGNVPAPADEPPELSQFEKDKLRYQRRAAVKDQLIAYMAADNMSRLRSGEWTVSDLVALLQDPENAMVIGFLNTLAFETAADVLMASSHHLLTPAIKADWVSRLQAHFYNGSEEVS